MRSSRNVLLAIFAVFLLSTALYFGFRSYNFNKGLGTQREIVPEELIVLERFPEEEKTAEKPEAGGLALPESTKSDTKPETEEVLAKPVDVGIKYSEKENEIEDVEGAVFLKSMLKDMACVMGEISKHSVSCCGVLSLSDDGKDDHQGCILMDTYREDGLDESIYRLRVIVDKEQIPVYQEVIGFPKRAEKSYPLEIKPGVDIWASVNSLENDTDVADDLGYKTCTFMKFGYNKQSPDLLGFAETIKCNSEKELISKKSSNTPDTLILRLKLKSPIEEYPKDAVKPIGDEKQVGPSEVKTPEGSDPERTTNATDVETTQSSEESDSSEQTQSTSSSDSDDAFMDLIIWPQTPMMQPIYESTDNSNDSDTESVTEEHTNEDDPYVQRRPGPQSAISVMLDTIINFIRENIINVIARPFMK